MAWRRRLSALCLALALPVPAFATEGNGWQDTLEQIATSVVAIRVDGTRAFDTDWNSSSQATGFVVDAELGLILTNRHVVSPGPVRAEALFLNQEEVELLPVYRDPVHDFGLFRYDPAELRYNQPVSLSLEPAGAEVGTEIRVVGNDAGEQLSILPGTIARLQRRAPNYGPGKYNDFNSFYIQAASGTSGGSSGSPVVDVDGRVVALNAGANAQAASSFFLPLDRVHRAVELIRQGLPVTRGTLEAIFLHKPFDELRRLGLNGGIEEQVRSAFPGQTGMLVVDEVITGGTSDGILQVGDILLTVNGEVVADFVPLAESLDDSVGDALTLEVERNGRRIMRQITVTDLHAITPASFIQFGDAIVNQLSYQQARFYNRPVQGVYVANPGYVFGTAAIPRGAVIVEVDGQQVDTLADLEAALEGLADQQQFAVRFYRFEDPQTSRLRVARMDRKWFPLEYCERDDELGTWPCRSLAQGPASETVEPVTVDLLPTRDRRIRDVAASLVLVNFDMPYPISGIADQHYYGTGLVADAERGLVVVDRNTVPVSMGDVTITVAGSLEIPGRVEFIHPLHNLAVVSYDPALVGDTPLRSATLNSNLPEPGAELRVVGLRGDHKLVSQATTLGSIEPVYFPLSRTLRFRESNIETLDLINGPEDIDGVIINRNGEVVSLWSTFAFQGGGDTGQTNKGVPIEYIAEMVDLVRDSRPLMSLEVEFSQMPLASARKLGLSTKWVERLERHSPERRQTLAVMRTVAGTPVHDLLVPGDMLLSVDGQVVSSFREAELAVSSKDSVRLVIWRDREELELEVATTPLYGTDVERVLVWAGALLQQPYRDMAAQRGIEPSGVYVAYYGYGSPASRYNLQAGHRIVEVDGEAVTDLDDFVSKVSGLGEDDSVRLTTLSWNNTVSVLTLKMDTVYWPSYELRRDAGNWLRLPLGGPLPSAAPEELGAAGQANSGQQPGCHEGAAAVGCDSRGAAKAGQG